MEQSLFWTILKGIDTEKAAIKKQSRINALQKLEHDRTFIHAGHESQAFNPLTVFPIEVIFADILISFIL